MICDYLQNSIHCVWHMFMKKKNKQKNGCKSKQKMPQIAWLTWNYAIRFVALLSSSLVLSGSFQIFFFSCIFNETNVLAVLTNEMSRGRCQHFCSVRIIWRMNEGVDLIDIDKVTKLISLTDVHFKWHIDGFGDDSLFRYTNAPFNYQYFFFVWMKMETFSHA